MKPLLNRGKTPWLCLALAGVPLPGLAAAIGITLQQHLVFGRFAPTASAGSVTISTAGGRTGSNVALISGAYAQAIFKVTGDADATYSITLPALDTVLLASGTNTMMVQQFRSTPATTGTLDANGQQLLHIGATLEVGSNQARGDYSATFDITVEYQ